MWRSFESSTPNVLNEISVRIALMLIVCIMHARLHPHMQYITERELLNEYKRPRRDSLTPAWAIVFLIIFVPLFTLTLPCIFAKNDGDTMQALLAWSLACAINAFLTETGKLVVGRPRPDFFYRCFPNSKMPKDLRCTGNLKDVLEGRKSFPSGHSSFSFCSLGFISMWMCGRLGILSRSRGHGVRVTACMLPLVIAAVVAVSRYCDNHHHWEDVLVGSIIGFTTSYFCYHQYYYPLNSEHAGRPYVIFSAGELIKSRSEFECCTRDLEASFRTINNKKESNKKNT